ncbi:MAG: TPM domain-containing protein [Acidobacteriota bacterium]
MEIRRSVSLTRSARFAFIAGCLLWIGGASLHAQLAVPERPTSWVNDYAGALQPEHLRALDQILASFEKSTTNQIFIGIWQSLQGENLEDYSIRVAEKWKAGQAGKENGIVILVFLADRRIRFEVGYGLEDKVPDIEAARIQRAVIAPHFREGRVFEGLRDAVTALIAAIEGRAPPPEDSGRQTTPFPTGALVPCGLSLFIFLYFLKQTGILRRMFRRGRLQSPSTWIGGSGWGGSSGGSWGGSSGGGWSSGGGGGGFSGGGGGSFGGGGASGSW